MPERYISQPGFVKAPVLRGFTEIRPLFDMLAKYGEKAFICGGYVRLMCSPRKTPNKAGDVDVYCQDAETYEAIKTELSKFVSVAHDSEVAVSFNTAQERENPFHYMPKIQLIKAINQGAIVAKGTMEEILSAFDFTCIRVGLISDREALVDADFLHDEGLGILRIKNIHCPISSTLRCMKYAKKGYWMTPTQTLKLFADWDNRDADYKAQIIDGLTKIDQGVELDEIAFTELYRLMKID